ncbi:MAG: hypothetical protein ACR2NZ_26075 [Rubripirellula sp.]
MRTLTLGVLIVSGGTLAALPFRRYQAIPDASAVPTQVTGPAQSALDSPPVGRRSNAVVHETPDEHDLRGAVLANHIPVWQQSSVPTPSQRQLDIPLTYDDLAVPIAQPKPIQDRFNATAAVRQKQVERERVASLEMPAMETLVASQQQELQRVIDSVAVNSPAAGGSLASTNLGSSPFAASNGASSTASRGPMAAQSAQRLDPLPATIPEQRQRHWIRQPN